MVALYVFMVIAMPAALGAYVAARNVTRSRHCPQCADETLPLRSRRHDMANRVLMGTRFQLRWCTTCGWRGTARVQAAEPARTATVTTSVPAAPDSLDIRRLQIDGRPWKVLVQCWHEEGRWIGRLLFMGPDGQAHAEDTCSLEGSTAIEVLSHALSMPERTLAGRIRRAIH
jgi:hypothetical protein